MLKFFIYIHHLVNVQVYLKTDPIPFDRPLHIILITYNHRRLASEIGHNKNEVECRAFLSATNALANLFGWSEAVDQIRADNPLYPFDTISYFRMMDEDVSLREQVNVSSEYTLQFTLGSERTSYNPQPIDMGMLGEEFDTWNDDSEDEERSIPEVNNEMIQIDNDDDEQVQQEAEEGTADIYDGVQLRHDVTGNDSEADDSQWARNEVTPEQIMRSLALIRGDITGKGIKVEQAPAQRFVKITLTNIDVRTHVVRAYHKDTEVAVQIAYLRLLRKCMASTTLRQDLRYIVLLECKNQNPCAMLHTLGFCIQSNEDV